MIRRGITLTTTPTNDYWDRWQDALMNMGAQDPAVANVPFLDPYRSEVCPV